MVLEAILTTPEKDIDKNKTDKKQNEQLIKDIQPDELIINEKENLEKIELAQKNSNELNNDNNINNNTNISNQINQKILSNEKPFEQKNDIQYNNNPMLVQIENQNIP